MAKRAQKQKRKHLLEQTLNPLSAGIDIGAEEIVAAIPPNLTQSNPVKTYESFTSGLKALRDWLLLHQIATVAMESTGVYWIPLYEILEEAGIEVCLVNARHVKGVPGKKTDVCDAQWLQQLHSAGLLKSSFRPRGEIITIRQLVRYRANCIQAAAREIQHMQKALSEMNLQIHHVFSDLDGVSAMRILEAILKGERDVEKLWDMRDGRVKAPKEKFLKAMEGHYQPAQLFILKQCHLKWKQEQEAIIECDREIEKYLQQASPDYGDSPPPALKPTKKHRTGSKNSFGGDIFEMGNLYYGVDLSTVDGVSAGLLGVLMSEIGTRDDLLKNFKTSKRFCSWLGLCPDQKISGGKVLQTKTRRVVNKITEALRLCAFSAGHSKSAMGEYTRRMKGRLGKVEGITAAAHKLARILYSMIASRQPYNESEAFKVNEYSVAKKEKIFKSLAKSLDIVLPKNLDSIRV